MENQRTSNASSASLNLNFWVDPSLRDSWSEVCTELSHFNNDQESAAWKIEFKEGDLALSDRKRVHLRLPNAKANLKFLANTLIEKARESISPLDNWEDQLLIDLAEYAQPLFFGHVHDDEAHNYLGKLASTISLKTGLDGFFSLRRFKEFRMGD